jgi:hypothetical protein
MAALIGEESNFSRSKQWRTLSNTLDKSVYTVIFFRPKFRKISQIPLIRIFGGKPEVSVAKNDRLVTVNIGSSTIFKGF